MWSKMMWLVWLVACDPADRHRSDEPLTQEAVAHEQATEDTAPVEGPDHDRDGVSVGDCAPQDPTVRPGIGEVPGDGVDQNCDGLEYCFYDADRDGYGTSVTVPTPIAQSCNEVTFRSSTDNDCDDHDPRIHPKTVWYRDEDGDGFGDPGVVTAGCGPGPGWVLDHSDCDDGDPMVGERTWFLDADGDGLGDPAVFRSGCQPRTGEVLNGDDCDDEEPTACAAPAGQSPG